MKPDDRLRPTYIVGKTGMGKSTLLLNCIIQDIQAGRGVAVIDPHGDLVEEALEYVPASRINETIYLNPADTDYPIGFNVLAHTSPKSRPLVASGLIQVFKKVWASSWGPRLEYVLRNCFLTLLEKPGNSLLGVSRLLTDERFRTKVVAGVVDPVLRTFWTSEFEQYPKVFRTETISPIQNKVGQFLTNPITRNILGQTKSKLRLSDVMSESRILLVNLAKGKIGEDNASLLGALLITQLYLAALQRTNRSRQQRRSYYLYIDELQSFATEEFPSMLSEARKYGLSMAGLANQFLSQLPDSLRDAVLGNVGTLITFAVGADDAKALEAEFRQVFSADDLLNLPRFQIYLKLSIDGTTSLPFSATTVMPPAPRHGNAEQIIRQSRERCGTRRESLERRIARWYAG
ncbi:MAG: hypothetical protein IPH75_07995 [bacterium]|nr:hypothetical protein [bacterium]